jgi:3-deoxy-manno-octulosonate cytidylyltransferase (CMP-KDO synthetase)
MNILGIIPARYGSTRLEGKPLAEIKRKPMIQHVYERASKALDKVIVATDDQRIVEAVNSFGGEAFMTSRLHSTGTNRCLEAFHKYAEQHNEDIDVVINIQGDEPMLEPESLEELASSFKDADVEMATLITQVKNIHDLNDPGVVFVVFNKDHDALYFSRNALPHVQGVPEREWLSYHTFYKHIGMYAFRPEALEKFAALPMSDLEKAESLEQNRWLENGRNIRLCMTEHEGISVDTPDDLERVRNII